jgi:predicted O-methyltransferase YrrM
VERVATLVQKTLEAGAIQCPKELAMLVEYLQPRKIKNVLEIGTESGGTMYLWGQLATGRIISLDLPNGASGSWSYVNLEARRVRNKKIASYGEFVEFVTGDSHEPESLHSVEWILAGEGVDLLFIDGDHSAHGVQQDYTMYRHLVNPGGIIVFHDIKATPHHAHRGCFVDRFWNRLDVPKKEFCSDLHWGGIGVLEV